MKKENDLKPLCVVDLPAGGSLGRLSASKPDEVNSTILPQSISRDNRWLLAMSVSLEKGELTIGEMGLRIHKLPGGDLVLRRTIRQSDDELLGGFPEITPCVAFLTDRATVEFWRLEPKAELIARWQPYEGKTIADLGFTGDTLYLRRERDTHLDLLPLPELNRRLETLGLGW
jgi:hypothetical protein